jgi:hypothetical protein
VPVDLSGNGNPQIAFNFFVQKGLTLNQAAGIVGNMYLESSGVVPTKVQGGANSQNPADAGSSGWGIVQWTPANTKVPGIIKAAGINGNVYDIGTQLDMLWAQLTGKAGGYSEQKAGDDIKSTTTLSDAVRAFQGDDKIGGRFSGFERPQDESASLARRTSLAQQMLKKYGGSVDTAVTAPAGSSCSSAGAGEDTQFIEGFRVYNQYDPRWANKPYGSSTIAESGCGPSAMAMIITAMSTQIVTPDQTAAYAGGKGLYISGAGSSWSIAPVLAKNWGLKATLIGADVAKITATLQSGGLVIASGQGPLPFTSGGHYIVIRGVTSDGKWKIGDSGHSDTSSQSWSPQQIVSSMNDGSVYAITR